MVNFKGLEKVRLVVATSSNEVGRHPDLARFMALGRDGTPAVPLHIHALLSATLPPFLSFLGAVLSHYQIHALHIDPDSLVLLSAFAFLCETFVGVALSVALFRHFFSLGSISAE
ncbi:hypothetical protein D1007_33407 [Hordeum vulgare]|nr:hypothetical protein D1007_33407 [Hordeum vulgare]